MARRLLSESECIEETGIPLATFRAWVEIGKLPRPIADLGLYDMKAIDQAIDKISGLGSATNALDAWRITRGK
jgi:hypothetical protein